MNITHAYLRFLSVFLTLWGFPVAQMVKNLPGVRETQVQSLYHVRINVKDNTKEENPIYLIWHSSLLLKIPLQEFHHMVEELHHVVIFN